MNADSFLRVAEVAIVPIAVALITASASAYKVVRSQKKEVEGLREENTLQHDRSSGLLAHLSDQVGGIDRKIDRIDNRVDDLALWAANHEKQHVIDAQRGSGGTL